MLITNFTVSQTMATKHNYESEKQLFTMLMDRFKSTFERDFLFYIALAYRARFL